MMSKHQVERNHFVKFVNVEWNLILAQNFANDAVKAGEDLAEQIPKQGQKLGEQAFELGKEKGKTHLIHLENNLIVLFFSLSFSKRSTQSGQTS